MPSAAVAGGFRSPWPVAPWGVSRGCFVCFVFVRLVGGVLWFVGRGFGGAVFALSLWRWVGLRLLWPAVGVGVCGSVVAALGGSALGSRCGAGRLVGCLLGGGPCSVCGACLCAGLAGRFPGGGCLPGASCLGGCACCSCGRCACSCCSCGSCACCSCAAAWAAGCLVGRVPSLGAVVWGRSLRGAFPFFISQQALFGCNGVTLFFIIFYSTQPTTHHLTSCIVIHSPPRDTKRHEQADPTAQRLHHQR